MKKILEKKKLKIKNRNIRKIELNSTIKQKEYEHKENKQKKIAL